MKDIRMCTKQSCKARKSCARFNPLPERGQVLFFDHPNENKHGSCDHFKAMPQPGNSSGKADLVEFFEKKLPYIRPKYYLMQHREDRVANEERPAVPGYVDEFEYEDVHIIVMADTQRAASLGVIREMSDIVYRN